MNHFFSLSAHRLLQKKCFVLAAVIGLELCSAADDPLAESVPPPKILMAGDSTMAVYSAKEHPMTGWGAVLHKWTKPDVDVRDYAQPGSRLDGCRQGPWKKILAECRPGDLVIIQFGHNDQKLADPYWTKPPLSREESLKQYEDQLRDCVTEAQKRGADVIVCSSIARLTVDPQGKLKDLYRLSDYCKCAEKVAAACGAMYTDMQSIFFDEIGRVTPAVAEKWYMVSVNGKDRTHLNAEGAKAAAGWFVNAVNRKYPELSRRFFAVK